MPHRDPSAIRRSASLLVLALFAASTAQAQAQDAAGAAGEEADPTLVLARTVNPRIAYRGLPRQDNPVRIQATTFPARVFAGAMDRMIDQLGGDELLGQLGSAGVTNPAQAVSAVPAQALGGLLGPGARGAGAATVPGGPGASIGGALGGAGGIGGVGATLTDALLPALAPKAAIGGGP